jgi:hypothetical protein
VRPSESSGLLAHNVFGGRGRDKAQHGAGQSQSEGQLARAAPAYGEAQADEGQNVRADDALDAHEPLVALGARKHCCLAPYDEGGGHDALLAFGALFALDEAWAGDDLAAVEEPDAHDEAPEHEVAPAYDEEEDDAREAVWKGQRSGLEPQRMDRSAQPFLGSVDDAIA